MLDYLRIYYYNLWQILMATCPYNTGNMKDHIVMVESPDHIEVSISAPKNNKEGELVYDYANAVNEGLAAQAQGRPMSPKEARNYHWVQRAVKQAALNTTDRVIFEGGFTI